MPPPAFARTRPILSRQGLLPSISEVIPRRSVLSATRVTLRVSLRTRCIAHLPVASITIPFPLSLIYHHFLLFDSLASTTFLLPPLLPFLRLYFCHLYDFPVHCHSPARLQPAISSFATLTVTNFLLVILVPNQAQATTAHTL